MLTHVCILFPQNRVLMELPQCISEVHNFFLDGIHIQAKRKMKLKTIKREILCLRFIMGIKVKYYSLKQLFGTQMCICMKRY